MSSFKYCCKLDHEEGTAIPYFNLLTPTNSEEYIFALEDVKMAKMQHHLLLAVLTFLKISSSNISEFLKFHFSLTIAVSQSWKDDIVKKANQNFINYLNRYCFVINSGRSIDDSRIEEEMNITWIQTRFVTTANGLILF